MVVKRDKIIEIVPLTFFRGRSFTNAICIIDEAQNLTYNQLKMAIGRLGKDSIMFFCGDYDQIDLKHKETSAIHCLELLKDSDDVQIIELIENHRHPAIGRVLGLLNNKG
jgi:phosphate starvation-inducible PhoH-like protein